MVRESDAQDWPAIPVGHVFVLRPDRYVAACMPLEQWHRRRAEIVSLIAATFDRGIRTLLPERRVPSADEALMRPHHVTSDIALRTIMPAHVACRMLPRQQAFEFGRDSIRNKFSDGAEQRNRISFSRLRENK